MNCVLIVDDQPAFRRQLRELLEYAGWTVVGEAGDVIEAAKKVCEHHPDLAIVDVFLQGMSGIEGTPLLKMASPDLKIILVSAYGDRVDIFRQAAIRAGAEELLSKDDLDLQRVRTWLHAL